MSAPTMRGRRHLRRIVKPASWMKAGATADYHSVIGGEVTRPGVLIEGDPFESSSGTWVVFVSGISGYVACEALTLPAESGR